MLMLYDILMILLSAASWVILIQAILSWLIAFNVINTYNEGVRTIVTVLDRMTEPLYRPIRKLLPSVSGLDLSPLVVLFIIYILQRAVLPNLFMSLM